MIVLCGYFPPAPCNLVSGRRGFGVGQGGVMLTRNIKAKSGGEMRSEGKLRLGWWWRRRESIGQEQGCMESTRGKQQVWDHLVFRPYQTLACRPSAWWESGIAAFRIKTDTSLPNTILQLNTDLRWYGEAFYNLQCQSQRLQAFSPGSQTLQSRIMISIC